MARNNALRTWWKPWTWPMWVWALVIWFSTSISTIVNRWICLSMVPDVRLPFNVEDVIDEDVPDDQSAIAVYQGVLKRLSSRPARDALAAGDDSKSTTELTIKEISERLLHHDEQALAEYIRAGQIEKMGGPSLRTGNFWTNLGTHQELRQLVRAYTALGMTLQDSGDLEKSWACHLANFRCSIHAERPRLAICGLLGIAMRAMSYEGIVKWASDPSLSAERLRTARDELSREYARRISMLDVWSGEYLAARNTLNQIESVDFLLPGNTNPAPGSPLSVRLMSKRAFLWCLGQPELALRTERQILLNGATEFDKPFHERRPSIRTHNGESLFELDPAVPLIPGQMKPEQLVRVLTGQGLICKVNREVLPAMASYDEARRRDIARFELLRVLFASHEFQRTTGHFPSAPEELVPKYLEAIPIDESSNDGSSLRYRREADGTALVWSVGRNGIDDQGSIVGNDLLDLGYAIKLVHPGNDSNDETQPKTDQNK